eukprot:2202438-Alexandrium_andersonii.AAC.1
MTSFVTAGKGRAEVSVETVANLTAQVLLRTAPPIMPGIFLLVGGGVCMRTYDEELEDADASEAYDEL